MRPLGKLRHLKPAIYIGESENKTQKTKQKNHTHRPRDDAVQRRPEKMLNLHTGLICEFLALRGASLQRLGEVTDFSNVQFSTKYPKAYKETGQHYSFRRSDETIPEEKQSLDKDINRTLLNRLKELMEIRKMIYEQIENITKERKL